MLKKKNLFQMGQTWIVAILFVNVVFPSSSFADTVSEYQIKAALIYKFLAFVEWPDTEKSKSRATVTIGILGKNPFGIAFKPVEGKIINGKTLVIKHFETLSSDNSLFDCQILFISASEKGSLQDIIKILNHHPVLTVGDHNSFIEKGGMVNLIEKDNRLRFEINDTAVDQTGIKIRSMLKRLAVRIIGG